MLSTVKRGKIGHLLTFKSILKILRRIFFGFFRHKSLYELCDHWLQSLNHWFCHQGYHLKKKNHWCPILPKVGLRSDTTQNHQINRKLDFLCERSDTKWSLNFFLNFLMVNNIVICTYVLHIGQLMVNMTAHRTFELFFRLKYGCGVYTKM